MGYIHDTATSYFVHPGQIQKSAGTWTPTLASNTVYDRRTAADASFNLFVPIKLPGNSVAEKGAYLKSIELLYEITTAAADDFATVELEKMVFDSDGDPTGSAPAVTLNTAEDTAAERKATGTHRCVVTLDTPVWVDNDDAYVLYCVVDAAATTVFDLFGAMVNFTLRL